MRIVFTCMKRQEYRAGEQQDAMLFKYEFTADDDAAVFANGASGVLRLAGMIDGRFVEGEVYALTIAPVVAAVAVKAPVATSAAKPKKGATKKHG